MTLIRRAAFFYAAMMLASICSPAVAQDALRCSSFLHKSDGTWRSFYQADLFGPDGVVHVNEGEILSPAAKSPKGEIARGLNALCAGR